MKCKICSSTSNELLCDSIALAKCSLCGHIQRFHHDIPDYGRKCGRALGISEDQQLNKYHRQAKEVVIKLDRYAPLAKSALDIGCAGGDLLIELSKLCPGIQVRGVEISLDRFLAVEKGLHVGASICEVTEKGYLFDMITVFHVLEHFEDPLKLMNDARNALNDGGILIVEVPEEFGNLVGVFDRNKEHLHYFSVASLTLLAKRAGLSVISLETGLEESAFYNNCLRVVCTKNNQVNSLQEIIEKKIGRSFAVAGVGGDFDEYLLGNIPDQWIFSLHDSKVEFCESLGRSVHPLCEVPEGVPIIVTSQRYRNDIESCLRSFNLFASIFHLSDLFEGKL